MKKALYLHGFLGGLEDMRPLFLEGYECFSFDLRRLLFKKDPIAYLAKETQNYDFILGYSFGGRILKELQARFSHKADQWVFVSTRLTPFSDEELKKREEFRNELFEKLQDRASFFEHWRNLELFKGYDMAEYRAQNSVGYTPWSIDEITVYLEKFFNSLQFKQGALKGSIYLYGDQDKKYTKEGFKLSDKISVYACSGGHRFLFEDPKGFKKALEKILKEEEKDDDL